MGNSEEGKHRHLNKPYLLNWIERQYEKLNTSKTIIKSVISEKSTMFFIKIMDEAFHGYRGL